MITEPKFQMGQVVYWPGYRSRSRMRQCPDCLGKMTWAVTTPAGETFEMKCGTCCVWLGGPEITETVYEPHVSTLTIGKIGMEAEGSIVKYRYMCHETGIGSGSIYDEDRMCATPEAAEGLARFCAHQAQTEYDARVKHNRDEQKRKARRKPCKACGR